MVVIGCAALVVVFIAAYVLQIAPFWSYSGLLDRPSGDGSLLLPMLLSLLPALWMPIEIERPSQLVLWGIYLLIYIPSELVPYLTLSQGWGTTWLSLSLAVGFRVLLLAPDVTLRRPQLPRMRATAFRRLVLGAAVLGLAVAVVVFGIPNRLPSNTSTTRTDYKTTLGATSVIVSYIVSWSREILLPALMIIGLQWRRYGLVAAAVVGMVYLYAVTAFKATVLLIGLVVVVYVALAYLRRWMGMLLPWGLALVVLFTGLAHVLGFVLPFSLLVRRLLAVPGSLTGYYYDYFTTHPPYLLSHSILSGIAARPSPLSPPNLIGSVYYGNPQVSANGNFWADGLANFGLPGIFVATLVLFLVLVVLDAAARGRPVVPVVCLLATACISLSNSALLTSLMTHGLLVAIVIAALWPDERLAGVRAPRDASQPTTAVAM